MHAGMPLAKFTLIANILITDAGLAAVLKDAPLTVLNLIDCSGVSNEGVSYLVSGKQITHLNLQNCGLVTAAILPTLRALPLVNLRLSEGVLSEADLEGLLKAVPSIKEVHLASVSSPDPAVVATERVLYGQASNGIIG